MKKITKTDLIIDREKLESKPHHFHPELDTSKMFENGGYGSDGRFYPWPAKRWNVCSKCGLKISGLTSDEEINGIILEKSCI